MADPVPPLFEPTALHSTSGLGESVQDGRVRVFPCDQCGANLEFSIGRQQLACPYCGAVKHITLSAEAAIVENDYQEMLQRLEKMKEREVGVDDTATGQQEIGCDSCGANVIFQQTLTSSTCPYCGSPLQRDKIHNATTRIPVDAVLPFLVPRERVADNLRRWVQSRWFAPNDFRREGVQGRFHGCYYPYFTFDSITFTRWTGERGDHYWVSVRDAQGKERSERRTRWTACSGSFERVFDDVLTLALNDDQAPLLEALEPWPLGQCRPYSPGLLAGMFARTYDVPLHRAFEAAKSRMQNALLADIRRRIGGDEQRVHSHQTSHRAVTFKHVLLPVWQMVYRYRGKTYRVTMNAATGKVYGERPWSWVKLTLLALTLVTLAVVIVALLQRL